MKQSIAFLKTHWPAIVILAIAVTAAATHQVWLPKVRQSLIGGNSPAADNHDHGPDEHGGHDHAHAGHSEETSIELSRTGLKNIDYQPITVSLGVFKRSITLPALVVERPGRSQMHITAPLTGVVTRIYPIEGAAVEPESPMFEIRLTHEELVSAQRDFLQTAENLDVINREINRLKNVGEGVVAGKRILEQEYEQAKLQASLRTDRQALLLHSLRNEQIDDILRTRQLLNSLLVRAPAHTHENDSCGEEHLFHVQQMPVKLGQQVNAGELMCILADHCELFIEGQAFEDDAMRLREAARNDWDIRASVAAAHRKTETVEGLKLLYLADHVDTETRAFRFYVRLPNTIALDQETQVGRRFVAWRFNPGQRMELQVPVEEWQNCIILPVEAIVDEGAESYVYQQNGDHFDRVGVHVEYQDQTSAVIANDGSVLPGDVLAARGAYQMHLALKNKAGGGIDPHAGHNH